MLYSSEMIPEGSRVETEPRGATPLQQAADALAAYGLRLVTIATGQLAVQRSPVSVAIPALARSPEQPIPATDLEEVTVYASRYAIDDRDANATGALSHGQIEQIPGTQDDALRALQALPGFAADDGARPYARGSSQDGILVVFDNVSLVDPFHLKNFESLISAFDVSVVERMQIYSGGFPVRFGTRAGAVIDLTPRAAMNQRQYTIALSVTALKASTTGRTSGGSVEWLAAIRRSTPSLTVEIPSGGADEPAVHDAVARLRWRSSERSWWTAGALSLDDRVRLIDPATETRADARYRDTYVWLSLDHQPDHDWSSRTTLSVAHFERQRNVQVSQPLVTVGTVAEDRDFASIELVSNWTFEQNSRRRWNFGAEAGYSAGEGRYARTVSFAPGVAGTFPDHPIDQPAAVTDTHEFRYAAYGSLRMQLTPKLDAELGLRVDGQRYSAASHDDQWSPRLNLRYGLTANLNAYASWGKFTQAQRLDEWRLEDRQRLPDSAQTATHEILGVTVGAHLGWSSRLELYRKHWNRVSPYYDSLLSTQTLAPDLSPDRVRIAPESAESKGVELSTRGSLGPRYQLWASCSWSVVSDELSHRDVPRSWDQQSALTAGIAWKSAPLALSATARYHTGWPRTPASVVTPLVPTAPLVALGARNTLRWGDYLAFDLHASWTKRLGASELELFADVTNLANHGNACCLALEVTAPTQPAVLDQESWRSRTINVGVEWRHH